MTQPHKDHHNETPKRTTRAHLRTLAIVALYVGVFIGAFLLITTLAIRPSSALVYSMAREGVAGGIPPHAVAMTATPVRTTIAPPASVPLVVTEGVLPILPTPVRTGLLPSEGATEYEVLVDSVPLDDSGERNASVYAYRSDSTALPPITSPRQVIPLATPVLQPLQAGERDDNALWDDYLLYLHAYHQTHQGRGIVPIKVDGRVIIQVVDAQGLPVLGASVEVRADTLSVPFVLTPDTEQAASVTVIETQQGVTLATLITQADGRTLFLPYAGLPEGATMSGYTVTVSKQGVVRTARLDRQTHTLTLELPITR